MSTSRTPGRTPASAGVRPGAPQRAADWQHGAACRQEDPELFFPTGTDGPALVQAQQAKAVCRRCPVVDECLCWALDSGQEAGVWGGMTEQERAAILAGQPMPAPQLSVYRLDVAWPVLTGTSQRRAMMLGCRDLAAAMVARGVEAIDRAQWRMATAPPAGHIAALWPALADHPETVAWVLVARVPVQPCAV